MNNIIKLQHKSKNSFKNNIYDALNKSQSGILEFLVITNKIKNIIILLRILPTDIENIICEYCNDIIELTYQIRMVTIHRFIINIKYGENYQFQLHYNILFQRIKLINKNYNDLIHITELQSIISTDANYDCIGLFNYYMLHEYGKEEFISTKYSYCKDDNMFNDIYDSFCPDFQYTRDYILASIDGCYVEQRIVNHKKFKYNIIMLKIIIDIVISILPLLNQKN